MYRSVTCPACGRRLRVPEELQAPTARCPACGGVFDVAPGATPGAEGGESTAQLPEALRDDGRPVRLIPVPPPPLPLRAVLISSSQDPGPPRRYGSPERCPECDLVLTAGAYSCPRCGARCAADDAEVPPWELPGAGPRRDSEPHRGPMLYCLGLVSLLLGVPALCGAGCPPLNVSGILSLGLGLTAWALAHRDLRLMDAKLMDLDGRAKTQLARSYAVAGVVLSGLGLFFSAVVYILPIVIEIP